MFQSIFQQEQIYIYIYIVTPKRDLKILQVKDMIYIYSLEISVS